MPAFSDGRRFCAGIYLLLGSVMLILGPERFFGLTIGGAAAFFGKGPALGCGASSHRIRRLMADPGFPFHTVHYGLQVHQTSCAVAHNEGGEPVVVHPATDALVTTHAGIALAVWTADCLPIVFNGPGVVAAAHCGWRGLAGGILAKMVTTLVDDFGCSVADIRVAIGPAVAPCHYHVGSEVISELGAHGVAPKIWRQSSRVDLRAFARGHLCNLGINKISIEIIGDCTSCDPELASFRRDGDAAGRQVTLIGFPVFATRDDAP